ncbi:ShlB/FhaC/HecB family hemolysin secretion/activation protein [Chitinimonas sp. BJB300]|uniref:ShlB/FhaC/HecB family hemolysin secretion/activation protein n=1 Tax=Chitinimonas sp. BJB300 TaxID=1559339 RepID=UPI000C0F3792|nr:POTRA domain-containing protein [Chitinimonas sp. BJB300]PHV09751.1 hypothetical protein CSQ89_19985 [Chitinimonas sp. BJB300]TSJ87504.1 ShlB/FhaC/HecB family hemolysin secretion/activation protein [Chitinimonas sp. BJB300]
MRLSQRLLRSPSLATPTFVSVVLLSGGSFSAIAADAIPAIDAGSLTRQQEHQRSEAERASHPSPALIDARPSTTKSTSTSDVKVMVNSVHFSGGQELLSPAERSAVLQQVTGRLLDFSALQALVNSITDTLHKKGYMFARAYLPSQDVTAGKLDIVIAEGRLDGSPSQPVGWMVNLSAGSRRPAQTWLDMAEAALPSGSVVKEASLERGLLLINDVPGLSAKGNLLAGENPGSVRVQLDVNEGKRFEGYLWADNYGSESTGRAQGHALVNINDPFGFKDQASLQISTSQGVNLGRLGYGFGMGSTGLRASIGYSQLSYDVVKGVGKAAGLEGKSNIASVNLSYPFIRTQRSNFRGGVGVERKAFKDESRLGVLRDKRSNVVTLSIGGDFVNDSRLAGFNLWRLAVATGDLDLSGAPSDAAVDASTRKTQGRWTKLNAYYSLMLRSSCEKQL